MYGLVILYLIFKDVGMDLDDFLAISLMFLRLRFVEYFPVQEWSEASIGNGKTRMEEMVVVERSMRSRIGQQQVQDLPLTSYGTMEPKICTEWGLREWFVLR